MEPAKICLVSTGASGWGTMRKRLEADLGPTLAHFVHLEDHWRGTSRIRSLDMSWAGRRALQAALRTDADLVMLTDLAWAGLLPKFPRKHVILYADATPWSGTPLYEGKPLGIAPSLVYRGLLRLDPASYTFVAMSSWCARDIAERVGQPIGSVPVIPPYADSDRWQFDDHDERWAGAGPLEILFIGGDFHRKGGDVLVSACGQLMAQGCDVRLHLVSKSAPGNLPGWAKVYPDFGPDDARLVRLASSCHVLALPTRADCSPIVVIEASLAGLPTIATSVGGIPDLVREGETGRLLSPVGVEQALIEALRGYHIHRGLARAHGRTAASLARQIWSRVAVIDRWLQLFERLTPRRASRPQPS